MEAKEKNPEEYEEYYNNEEFFNISEALHVICEQINYLKRILDRNSVY